MNIEVYTDGSATTQSLPGGWAYVICVDSKKFAECSGHMAGASNNDAELEAAIQGLSAVYKLLSSDQFLMSAPIDFVTHKNGANQIEVFLVSDSQLVLGWASGRYAFKQESKIEKYTNLRRLMTLTQAQTRWVEGHAGHEFNERCDELANEARIGVNRDKDKAEAILAGKTLIGTKKKGTVCLWYKDALKVIDLETNVIENYDRSIHGPRGGTLEIREEKSR